MALPPLSFRLQILILISTVRSHRPNASQDGTPCSTTTVGAISPLHKPQSLVSLHYKYKTGIAQTRKDSGAKQTEKWECMRVLRT